MSEAPSPAPAPCVDLSGGGEPLLTEGLGQIAVTVSDVAAAKAFYHGVLELPVLFDAGPSLAFLAVEGIRLMLTTPQGHGEIGKNSVLYFKVRGIVATYAKVVAKGAIVERAPALVAAMPDHDLWIGFVRDPDGNLVGLMEEVRPPVGRMDGGNSN